MFRSIDLCVLRDACHELVNFVPLGIFMRQGRRTQSYQNDWRSIASVQLQLLDFLYIVHSQKRATSRTPPPPFADPVRYIKKIMITNKRTTHFAIKILITIFCYGKGIEVKMCLQHSTLLVQWRQRYKEYEKYINFSTKCLELL